METVDRARYEPADVGRASRRDASKLGVHGCLNRRLIGDETRDVWSLEEVAKNGRAGLSYSESGGTTDAKAKGQPAREVTSRRIVNAMTGSASF
jgi:hypothetical protein